MISTGKRATESFVVAKQGNSAMIVSGTLNNSSTGNVNLADGALGLVALGSTGSVAPNAFMDGSPSAAENSVVAIFQGTSASSNVAGSTATYPLVVRPYERTQALDGRKSSILVTKQAFRTAKHSAWVVGAISSASTGGINVLDSTEYRLYVSFMGRRMDEMMSANNMVAGLSLSVITPDFTALSATYPLPVDWIVTKFGYEINRNSQAFNLPARRQGSDPVVALAAGIALSGPGGAAAGTAISGITAGDSFVAFVHNGVNKSIVITAELLATLTEVSADTGFTHLFTIDLANAGTNTGGTATGLIVIGLDSRLAYIDRIPQVKTRIRVGLKSGFDYLTVNNVESVYADEGQGYARPLDLLYQATQGQRKYTQRHVEDPVINYPSPVDLNLQYVVYNINHGRTEQIDVSNMIYSPYREIVLIPRYSTGTTTNPLIADFDTIFGAWLASVNQPAIINLV